ncbi:hypothetical protein [Streptomyces exfoliatus]|uniref:hypothetical protein n=1 Tax=Streptomyces exfoliatus TaxID=1905 RepID=UPI00099C804A|nr:hypothetical protein [Streptomyces exfoliatus]
MATGSDRPETDFPRAIGAPATRALASAGYTRLDQRAPACRPEARRADLGLGHASSRLGCTAGGRSN